MCRCVAQMADTLKPEYADALRRIEVERVPVKDHADAAGISADCTCDMSRHWSGPCNATTRPALCV